MLQIDSPITLDAATIKSGNICDQFSHDDLARLGAWCADGLARDDLSRKTWLTRNDAGMDLALQIQEAKTFPWPNASNVKFPLVTIAAMQFHARAYPAILNGQDVVKCEVNQPDPSGEITARSERISTHMSWQVLKQDRSWEEQEDRTLFNVSIVGTAFKKSYYDSERRHNVSELVMAKDLVIDYWAKSVEDCPRKTHLIPMSRNDIRENVLVGLYRDILEDAWFAGPPQTQRNESRTKQDNRQGVQPPQSDETTTFQFAEQHVNVDLDGDGYAEPWIITFDVQSKTVVRIVCRFDSEKDVQRVQSGRRKGEIICIEAMEYFTKRSFIPNPDGGIYDIGFGVFLGPLNESVNTLINQLIDAGTMQTASGGFLGRGAKIRGGVYTFSPFEWKRVDSTGDDLRKNLVKLDVNEPSAVLFNLLSMLINYTNRVSGTTDMMVGENPGQNTPAQTAQTMVTQGEKIYSAIFKRTWRGLAEEFRKLYKLNAKFLVPGITYVGGATTDDYLGNPDDISPAADPNVTSEQQRLQTALMLKQNAMTTPGYDRDAVERRVLKAMQVDAPDAIFKGANGTPPPEDPKITIAKMKNEIDQAKLQADAAELQFNQQKFLAELEEERRINDAKILDMAADAQQKSALAQTEAQYAQVAQINAQISVMKTRSEHYNKLIDGILRRAEIISKHQIEMKKAEKEPASVD